MSSRAFWKSDQPAFLNSTYSSLKCLRTPGILTLHFKSSLCTERSEQAELSKLPSQSLFDASSSLDLLLKSRFFYVLSKYLAISISKYIQQDINIKYNLDRIYFEIYLWYDNSSRLKHVWSLCYHFRKKKKTLIFLKIEIFEKNANTAMLIID